MSKNTLIKTEIKNTLGIVPGFFDAIPEGALQNEWDVFKKFQIEETNIPPKYRELIGLGIASALHCWYCAQFHKESALQYGATEEEITEAVYIAKQTTGWSAFLNGTLYDKEQFQKELKQISEYVAEHQNG